MKRFLIVLFLLLASVMLAACGSKPADDLVEDVIQPPATPTMGEPIQFELHQELILTDGTDIVSVTYLGKDEFFLENWTCVTISDKDCAQREGNRVDMMFYLNASKIGETNENSASFAEGWTVVQ